MNCLKLLLSSLLLVLSMAVVAQHLHPCGTQMGRSEWLKSFQNGEIPTMRSGDDWLVVPIYVHITGEDNGGGYTSPFLVGEAIHIMNEAFEQVKVQFFLVDDYNYINNSDWHNHESFGVGRDMMYSNNVNGAVNIYINNEAAGACGYYSGGPDAISINNDCLDPVNHTLAHEMGHLLSLPHPFVGWEGRNYDDSQPTPNSVGGRAVEKVDGSNCSFAGDGFCQTPPDYLSYRWPCNTNGQSQELQFDPDGASFRSEGNIIMSYSTGDCRNKFSDDQIDAMCANITDQRPGLLNHNREYKPLAPCERVTILSPGQLDSVQFDNVNLVWSNIPNIDFFKLEIATDFNFNNVVLDIELNDSTYTLNNLISGNTYFWKVTPVAAHSPCVKESQRKIFQTHDFSEVFEFDQNHSMNVWFNGNQLVLRTENFELRDAVIDVYNTGDMLVAQHNVTSTRSLELPLPQLNAGLYVVHIQSAEESVVLKIMK